VENNLALVYTKLGEYQKALEHIFTALKLLGDLHQTNHSFFDNCYIVLGQIYDELNDYQTSIAYFKKSLAVKKKNGVNLAESYNYLGNIFMKKGNLKLSKHYYDSAITFNTIHSIDQVEYINKGQYLSSIKGMIELISLDHHVEIASIDSLLADVERAIQNAFSLDSPTITGRISFIIEKMIWMHQKAGKNKISLQTYWNLFDLYRNTKLKSQLKTAYNLQYLLPASAIERDHAFIEKINLSLRESTPGSFNKAFFQIKRDYELFKDSLASQHPTYHRLKYSRTKVSDEDIYLQTRDSTLILNFFQGPKTTYFLTVKRNGYSIDSIGTSLINEVIDRHNQSVLRFDQKGMAETSLRILKQLHISDLEPFKSILVIPDKNIWNLNLNAILLPEGTYLGQHVPIHYNYQLKEDFSRENTPKKGVLAFSYSDISGRSQNLDQYYTFRNTDEELPGSFYEVKFIENIFDGDYFYGGQASETVFKDQAGNYQILHLAVHGLDNVSFPENSYLKFESEDSLNDGYLYAYEIYNQRLNAELAALVACESGSGRIENGEGIMSMARAFSYAGVQSLLASRWNVSDVSAPFILKYFYGGLKEGMKKSEALLFAQQKYLTNHADDATSSPYYWAGFYIIGEDDPLNELPNRYKNYLLITLLGVAFFVLFAIVRRRSLSF
ncbi:MAG: CHAT domain-containing tetratricopeptide repeat protein, partial [Bacteroidota bacterium]